MANPDKKKYVFLDKYERHSKQTKKRIDNIEAQVKKEAFVVRASIIAFAIFAAYIIYMCY